MEIAIITREREEKLLKCIKHVANNSVIPHSIIIVKTRPFVKNEILVQIKNILIQAGIRLKYKQINDFGISYARNMALSMVTDDIFAFIDDDEICPKNWIKTAENILSKHQNVTLLTGYKEIFFKNNYWNHVWKELCKRSEKAECFTEFATSSDTFYRISLIKKYNIVFDNDFNTSSEDLVFSHKVIQRGGLIWFSYKVKVKHEFRTSLLSMVRQWFDYGKTTYLFQYKYINSGSFLNSLSNILYLLQGIRTEDKKFNLIPGLIVVDISFGCGYLYKALTTVFKNNVIKYKYDK
jgi:glycosyltransferase involved in cell wall biosynthesis